MVWQGQNVTPLPDLPGTTFNEAYAINGKGQVAGVADSDLVLWDHGRVIDLSALLPPGSGWSELDPWQINDTWLIVGGGVHNGKQRGFQIIIR